VASIEPDVLHRIGLQEDGTPAGKALQEVLTPLDARARFELNI
jgi:hypothetical protein